MYNFHPPLSAFPFALITLVALLEIFNFRGTSATFRAAIRVNLFAAGVATIAAFLSGYGASEAANQSFTVADEVIARHHFFGRFLLFVIIPCVAVRLIADRAKHGTRLFVGAYYLLLVVSIGLVVYTGFLGGKLVFESGAGVSVDVRQSAGMGNAQ